MTPGSPDQTQDLSIYRGARWSFDFLFVVTDTDTPLDLTGLGPFVCQIKDPRRDSVLVTPTVTSDYDATGVVTITIDPADSLTLPLGNVRMGLRDTEGNPYLEWMPEVKWFTPTF